jgi:hypothetical protein
MGAVYELSIPKAWIGVTNCFEFNTIAQIKGEFTVSNLGGETHTFSYCFVCDDKDEDGVCDEADKCPNSRKNELIDANGCDPFQFCRPFYCGPSCLSADFIPLGGHSEGLFYPHDCTVVIIFKEGTLEPRCVPLTCLN